ncbi:MAG TPA: maleylpyruvate isomerase family mycothiol-dependent enzyme [Nocardioides sp.]|uniref:maleylpyruvate isomerase family mycothiol-dependent enzyme n=1 Tax=Nocardioides sp. TaxID=35761 RepID=UPI002ED99C8D
MTRLSAGGYLDHIRSESARFRAALAACDPDAPVPSCPEWTAADLLWHLGGEVQHFWNWVVRHRPEAPDGYQEAERPESYADLLSFFDATNAAFVAALAGADPAEAAWSWAAEQTVGFTFRRQAHEALVHRIDAELTVGALTPLDPALAADGVDEALDVMFGGTPPWGSFAPLPHHVRVDSVDVGASVWVQLGRFTGTAPDGTAHDTEDVSVVADPGTEPDVVVSGPAAALDAWLWRRGGDEAVTVSGDRSVYDRFRACVNQPIT